MKGSKILQKWGGWIIGIAFLLCGCVSPVREQQKGMVVRVSLDSIETIQVMPGVNGYMTALDSKKGSLLYDVRSVMMFPDMVVIFSRGRVSAFDLSSGMYLYDIGRKGKAADEYSSLADVFTDDVFIYLYDTDRNTLLRYTLDGTFCGILQHENSTEKYVNFQAIRPIGKNGCYVGKSKYGGRLNTTPELCLYDKDLNVIEKSLSFLNDGLTTFNNFHTYGDRLLYWKVLCDTIYSVDDNLNINPKYIIDFGKYRIPETVRSEYPDIYDLIDYTNTHKENIASMIQYVVEDDSTVMFRFFFNEKLLLAVVDKNNGQSKVYDVQLPEGIKQQSWITKYKDSYVIAGLDVSNLDRNFQLFFFQIPQ